LGKARWVLTPRDCTKAETLSGITVGAAQLAVVPPLLPVHCQLQGPVPVGAVAVPPLQRAEVGAVFAAAPVADPHTPFTGVEADPFGLSVAVVYPTAVVVRRDLTF
jgi:hypothetical protein